ncbi:hypothetical protein SDJN02_21826, partial [Cucurbita argyrosperma subsp. argyrosperma]
MSGILAFLNKENKTEEEGQGLEKGLEREQENLLEGCGLSNWNRSQKFTEDLTFHSTLVMHLCHNLGSAQGEVAVEAIGYEWVRRLPRTVCAMASGSDKGMDEQGTSDCES